MELNDPPLVPEIKIEIDVAEEEMPQDWRTEENNLQAQSVMVSPAPATSVSSEGLSSEPPTSAEESAATSSECHLPLPKDKEIPTRWTANNRYNLRNIPKKAVYNSCEEEEQKPEKVKYKVSVGENLSDWQKVLLRHKVRGTMDIFRAKEKRRFQEYHKNVSEDRKAVIRELTRLRVQKLRAKRKEESQAGILPAVARQKTKGQKPLSLRKDAVRLRKRRGALTQAEKDAVNKRRRELYKLKKAAEKPALNHSLQVDRHDNHTVSYSSALSMPPSHTSTVQYAMASSTSATSVSSEHHLCGPSSPPPDESAKEIPAELTANNKYSLRIRLKKTVYSSCEEEEEDNYKVSMEENLSAWQKKLLKHEICGTINKFRAKQKSRFQIYRKNVSEDRKAVIRELTRLRVQKLRAKRKAERQAGILPAATRKKTKVQKPLSLRKDAVRVRMRRATLTQAEKDAINKRRRELYKLKKSAEKPALNRPLQADPLDNRTVSLSLASSVSSEHLLCELSPPPDKSAKDWEPSVSFQHPVKTEKEEDEGPVLPAESRERTKKRGRHVIQTQPPSTITRTDPNFMDENHARKSVTPEDLVVTNTNTDVRVKEPCEDGSEVCVKREPCTESQVSEIMVKQEPADDHLDPASGSALADSSSSCSTMPSDREVDIKVDLDRNLVKDDSSVTLYNDTVPSADVSQGRIRTTRQTRKGNAKCNDLQKNRKCSPTIPVDVTDSGISSDLQQRRDDIGKRTYQHSDLDMEEDEIDIKKKRNSKRSACICSVCKKKFKSSSYLTVHMRQHTGEKPYSCTECDAAFTRLGHLRVHKRTHTGEKPYCCTVCGAAFIRSGDLTVHKRKHLTKKPYPCTECPAAFTKSGDLKIHMRKHTGIKPYECTECDAAFTATSGLKIHMRKHTGEKPYPCSECGASFKTSGSLTVHKRKHTGQRPYVCVECDSAFTQSSDLTIHMRKHTGEKPYACKECPSAFKMSSHLKAHMRKHSGESPYACAECETPYTESCNLKGHLRKDPSEKPYCCTKCKTAFTLTGNLEVHTAKPNGLNTYSCPQCDAAFTVMMQCI